jgi:hypothetical protein
MEQKPNGALSTRACARGWLTSENNNGTTSVIYSTGSRPQPRRLLWKVTFLADFTIWQELWRLPTRPFSNIPLITDSWNQYICNTHVPGGCQARNLPARTRRDQCVEMEPGWNVFIKILPVRYSTSLSNTVRFKLVRTSGPPLQCGGFVLYFKSSPSQRRLLEVPVV